MSQELIYTSAPRGLKSGSRGFCTVASTQGIPAPLVERLESLSGYRPIYPAGSSTADENPVSYAHWRISVGGKMSSVLSRVAFVGFDYTQRSNKLAHHLVLDASEQTLAGPAWVMMQPGILETDWSGEPHLMPAGRRIPGGDNPLRVCQTWAAMAGDAGWAGALVDAFILDASKPAYIIYEPGMDLLPLINEAIALLPPHLRWQVTFNTYFTELPAGSACTWRCCIAGTSAAKEAGRLATSGIVVDLRQPKPCPANGLYVRAAREGVMPASVAVKAPQELVGAGGASGGSRASFDTADGGAPYDLQEERSDRKMPSTTPFGGDASGGGVVVVERHKTSAIFWVLAALWPVVVALAVWALWLSAAGVPEERAAAATSQPSSVENNSDSRLDDLLRDNERMKQELADKADFIAPKVHQAMLVEAREVAFAEGQASPDPERYVEITARAEPHDEADPSTEQEQPAGTITAPPDESASSDTPTDEVGRPLVLDIPAPDQASSGSIPLEIANPIELELKTPESQSMTLSAEQGEGGTALRLKRPPTSGIGNPVDVLALAFDGSDGLKYEWLDNADARDHEMLKACVLVVSSSGSRPQSFQFFEPFQVTSQVGYHEKEIMLPFTPTGEIRLVAHGVNGAWRVDETGVSKILLKAADDPNISFEIGYVAANNQLRCGWQKLVNRLIPQRDRAKTDLEPLKTRFKNADKAKQEINADTPKWRVEQINEEWDKAKPLYDTAKEALDKAEKKLEVMGDAAPLSIRAFLLNGVCLFEVSIEPSEI